MKKILILLALLMIMGINSSQALSPKNYYFLKFLGFDIKELMMEKEPKKPSAEVEKDLNNTLYDNGLDAISKLYKEENIMISPLSLIEASNMMMSGAGGETLEELESYLGDNNHLNKTLKEYRGYPQEELKSANSLWVENMIKKDFIELTKKNGAEVYRGVKHKKINKWVDDKTDGMIKEIADKNIDGMPAVLINALSFEALWNNPYEGEYFKDYFIDIWGKKNKVDFMSFMNEDEVYLENEKAKGFIKYYKTDSQYDVSKFPNEGRFKFMAILPNGFKFNEYVKTLDYEEIESLLNSHTKYEEDDLYIQMPKFTSEYSSSLKELFKQNGVTKAFDAKEADFKKMSDEALLIDDIIQKTFIEVDKSGTKAAAVTIIKMDMARAPVEKKLHEIKLNRPFIYLILDHYNNPVFIGIQTNIK